MVVLYYVPFVGTLNMLVLVVVLQQSTKTNGLYERV